MHFVGAYGSSMIQPMNVIAAILFTLAHALAADVTIPISKVQLYGTSVEVVASLVEFRGKEEAANRDRSVFVQKLLNQKDWDGGLIGIHPRQKGGVSGLVIVVSAKQLNVLTHFAFEAKVLKEMKFGNPEDLLATPPNPKLKPRTEPWRGDLRM